jgi:putative flippase GtrA
VKTKTFVATPEHPRHKSAVWGFTNFREVALYIAGGAGGTILNLATAYVLTSKLHWFYFYSYIIGGLVNYTFNFFFHRAITFEVKNKTAKRALIYYSTNIALGAFALLLVYIFTSILKIHYLISGVMATAIIVIINFIFSKLVTFNKKLK